jgi:hypothetical protein
MVLRPALRALLVTAVLVAGPVACAAPGAAAQEPDPPAPAGTPLTRADLWAFADRRMLELDPYWRAEPGAYVTRSGASSTRMIANALAVHAWAALAGHQGPARRDERLAAMAALLTRRPAFVERLPRPQGGAQYHVPGWTRDAARLRPRGQHVALDAEVADALRAAWLAREAARLSPATSAAIVRAISATARSRFYRWPALRLNQFNWQARLYAADATVTGDPALLRADFRNQLTRFLARARRAPRGRSTNLNDGLGFLYLPNRAPDQRANRVSTSEYGNMVFDGLSGYQPALAAGMQPLATGQATLLRAWAERLLAGEWTHAGYLNWDSGLGLRRWQHARYWVWALGGLATLADQPILSARGRTWARWVFDRALGFYEAQRDTAGRLRVPSVLYGVRSTQADPLDRRDLATTDPGFLAARVAATVARQAATRPPGDAAVAPPPPLYAFDPSSRRLAVTTPVYSAAVVDRSTATGYGGADLARLIDARGRPLGAIGSRESHGFGLRVTRRGRALLETQRGRRSAALMRGPERRRGTFDRLGLRATVRGRRGTRVTITRRFRRERIETRYLVRGPRFARARLRLPVWSGRRPGAAPLVSRRRDGALVIRVRQPEGRYRAVVFARRATVRWRRMRPVRSSPGTQGILEVSVPVVRGRARISLTLLPGR